MKTKTFKNYQLIACTAIAVTAGASGRQDAILVHDIDACSADADQVLYGYDLASMDEETFFDTCENDCAAFSSNWEDLDSVLIGDEPIYNYCF